MKPCSGLLSKHKKLFSEGLGKFTKGEAKIIISDSQIPVYATTAVPPLASVHPWEWPGKPWMRIHVDFAGPIKGQIYLIVIDSYSKWLEIIHTDSATAEVTIRAPREIMSRWGLPLMMVSDNGHVSKLTSLLNSVNITILNTQLYRHIILLQMVLQNEPYKYSRDVSRNSLDLIFHISYCTIVQLLKLLLGIHPHC